MLRVTVASRSDGTRHRDAPPDRGSSLTPTSHGKELAATWARTLNSWMMRRSFRFCQYHVEWNYFSAVVADFGAAGTRAFWPRSSCISYFGLFLPMRQIRVALSHSRVTRFAQRH